MAEKSLVYLRIVLAVISDKLKTNLGEGPEIM